MGDLLNGGGAIGEMGNGTPAEEDGNAPIAGIA